MRLLTEFGSNMCVWGAGLVAGGAAAKSGRSQHAPIRIICLQVFVREFRHTTRTTNGGYPIVGIESCIDELVVHVEQDLAEPCIGPVEMHACRCA